MAIGELVAKLFCDSTDFDKNIKKSQKEVQEFKRKTEQNAAKVNSALNNMGSVAGKVSPKIGSLVGSLGKLGTVAAVGGAAIGGLSEIVEHNEFLTDAWEKKVTQASGALDSLWTTMAQGANSWRNLISNLKESIRLYGQLAEIKDNLGTTEGFALLSGSKVDAAINKYKEAKKNPNATKEQIAKYRKEAENAINEDYIVTLEQKKWLKEQYETQVGTIYSNTINKNSPVNKEKGQQIIKNFIEDKRYYNRYKDALSKISGTTPADRLIYSKFFKSLVKNLFKDAYDYDSLFNPALLKYNRGTIAGIRDFLKNLDILPEGIYLRPAQETLASINSLDATASAKKNAYFKQLATDNTIKLGKGGSVYASKQEAPKERTLQDILDDLDKSLVYNKFLAQNLGEDINGLNSSTFEKTINELKDLIKNTENENLRAEIVKVIKSLNDRAGLIVNNTKERPKDNKPEGNITKAYDVKSAYYDFMAIDAERRIYNYEDRINNGEKGKPLLRSMIEEFKGRGLTINFDVENLSDETLLKASGWNAEKFFKANGSYSMDTSVKREGMSEEEKLKELNIELGKFKDALKVVIAIARNSYITRRGTKNQSDFISVPDSNLIGPIAYMNHKLRENIPGSGINSFIFGKGDVLSNIYLSNIDTIRRKYTGFGDFYTSFKRYAVSDYLRERQNNNNIDTPDVIRLIYDAYNKALADNPDVPRLYKSADDLLKDNPFYDEQHPHDILKGKVDKIINYKNLSLLALEDLENINEIYTNTEVGVDNNKASKLGSRLLNIFDKSKIEDFFKYAEIDNVYKRDESLNKMLESLNTLRNSRIKEFNKYSSKTNVSQKTLELNSIKKIKEALILLIKEKEKKITDEELKRLNELRNDSEIGVDIKGYEGQSVDFINDAIAEKNNKIQELNDTIKEYNDNKEKFENEINSIDKSIKNTEEAREDNDELIERAKQYKELTNEMYAISDAAAQIGTAFSSLDSEFGDVAGSIFNIIGITAEAIGKILGMATAEGTLSAMKLPWPKNLAAIATVIAAGASVASQVRGVTSRKYATGGIVSGPGTGISDSIPIRVSNGEMILNHRQQSNLFNLLDKGSSTERKIEFKNKLVGSDIIGSATTYNKRRNLIL